MRSALYLFFFISFICTGVWGTPLQDDTDYTAVDERARNAPEFDDLGDLTHYLIKPYQGNEKFKVRVIYAWIVYHIQYDWTKFVNIEAYEEKKRFFLPISNIYKTRLGVCEDIASLFTKMAMKANLRSERIVGSAGYDLTPDRAAHSLHAWNVVKINGEWFLLDATWDLPKGSTFKTPYTNLREYKKIIQERIKNPEKINPGNYKIDDDWFLIPPEEMIKTHFPDSRKWQLLKHTVIPEAIWEKNQKKEEDRKRKNRKNKNLK